MTHARGALFIAAGAAALLLSACGSTTDGVATPGTTAATATSAAETSSAAASTTKSGSADMTAEVSEDVTKPGTKLKVGDRAVVPFKYGTQKTGTIALTVTAIEEGSNADLAKFGDKAKGITPVYIRVTVENVGGTDLAHSSLSLRALGADGKGTGVIISGDTDQCESETAGKDFTKAGAKYETCVLQGTREGTKAPSASYNNGDGYDKSPLVWQG
ncbi:hypothetical protein ABZ816_03500 [Actinosynnema sp. NPDC047251]|uniref:Secreted protein n=1 Tax=Saccharothrix espanaensis (strain ATCC 51144 / DSM 44229 / JCM 9112 / NBRC 15066 / NRRL 15764) TaxID=1179773 RepID=K0K430_SACES|nr:hypothetical protein [Saccharothrix espanaensis]CCH31323.1 hypothetical protein BN6_40370 [Saccharothrix espanaensis DSM 44229]